VVSGRSLTLSAQRYVCTVRRQCNSVSIHKLVANLTFCLSPQTRDALDVTHSTSLALIHNRLSSNLAISASNYLPDVSVSITHSLHRRLWHTPNQAYNKRHDQHQQRCVDIKRNLRRDPSRVKAVRKRLASRLKRAERTSAARGLFDVGGKGAEDPVELELGPVSGDEEDEVGEV
jgi:hypothetical protein